MWLAVWDCEDLQVTGNDSVLYLIILYLDIYHYYSNAVFIIDRKRIGYFHIKFLTDYKIIPVIN